MTANRTADRREREMWTIIDVASGLAMSEPNSDDPALFDTESEAMAWGVEHGYADNEHRTKEV